MSSDAVVRAARPEDAPAMARVHVRSWQETYRLLTADQRSPTDSVRSG